MNRLAKLVFLHAIDRVKARVILQLAYHLAVHDKFYEARDMFLGSHVGDGIQHSDVNMQILFHRTTAQLGLAAFRAGLIEDAHAALQEICSTMRMRELLGQVCCLFSLVFV